MRSLRPSVRGRWAGLQALGLALLLLGAQTIAHLHGLAHGIEHRLEHAGGPARAVEASSGLDALFADHDEDSPQCRLVDQLGHEMLLLADGPATDVRLPADAPMRAEPDHVRGPGGPSYCARAPPLALT